MTNAERTIEMLLKKCRYLVDCYKMNLEIQQLKNVPIHVECVETLEAIDSALEKVGK